MINANVNKDNICFGVKQEGKALVRYCCESARRILEGAVNMGVRKDDFWGSFVPTFAGLENHTRAAELTGTTIHFNHQFTGCKCDGKVGNGLSKDRIINIKAGIAYHIERLECNSVRIYYLESLLSDTKSHNKEINRWLTLLLKKCIENKFYGV